MDLHEIRSEYSLKGLRRKDLSSDPFLQFQSWIETAQNSSIPEPNAMVLATATPKGLPSTRTVLLKRFDNEGLFFFTNYESQKAHEIEQNPVASVTFLWKELERQVNIQGFVKKTSREISEEYFSKRPRKSQLGAVASHQSQTIESRDNLEKEYHRLDQLYSHQPIPCPSSWGGFIIKPTRFEFWQGRPNRLHDRFQYVFSDNEWLITRLSP